MALDFSGQARRLRDGLEPLAGGVYVAPEAYAAYDTLGFDGPVEGPDGATRPDPNAYFTSRGACMGRVSGEVVAAAFGCFNPKVVVPAVEAGWQITSREAVLEARERGAPRCCNESSASNPTATSGSPTCSAVRPRWRRGQAARSLGACSRRASPATRWVIVASRGPAARAPRGQPRDRLGGRRRRRRRDPAARPKRGGGYRPLLHPSPGGNKADMDAGFDRLKRRGLTTEDEKITDAGRAFREQIEVSHRRARTAGYSRPSAPTSTRFLTTSTSGATRSPTPDSCPRTVRLLPPAADRISAPGRPSTLPPICTPDGHDIVKERSGRPGRRSDVRVHRWLMMLCHRMVHAASQRQWRGSRLQNGPAVVCVGQG